MSAYIMESKFYTFYFYFGVQTTCYKSTLLELLHLIAGVAETLGVLFPVWMFAFSCKFETAAFNMVAIIAHALSIIFSIGMLTICNFLNFNAFFVFWWHHPCLNLLVLDQSWQFSLGVEPMTTKYMDILFRFLF